MALIEWQYGEQPLTGSKSHWFAAHLDFENGNLLIIVPYTDDYGSGSPPWTVTLTAFAIDPSGNVISAPVPLATYATGFDFAVSDVGLTGHQTAVFWTSANGTYPASSAVDLNFRPIDANGNPVGTATTLLSDVNDLEQFRVSSAGTGGTSVGVAYSTYDASTRAEVIRFKGFNPDGTPIATEDVSLDGFTGEVGYDSFGFGTLTPASGAKPSFIYLRAVDDEDGNVGLSYRTIGTNGVATAASVPVALPYSDGSSNRHLVDWLWDRLDPPAAGANNLVTVALLAEKGVHGYADDKIDVQIIDTDSGVSTEDTILFQNPSLTTDIELAETRLANGGVVIGYSSDGYSELKFYDNAGDVIGLFTFNIPHDPTTFSLETLPDGRLAVVYPTDAGDALAYNVFTVPTGPIDYDIHAGSTRNGIELREYDIMTVEAGGKAVGTIVDQFGNGIYVHSGGATSGTILNGGDEQILAGAFAEGTIIAAGATQNVVTGGVATGTLINNGQQMTAGTTKGTTINSGFQFAGQPSQDFDTVIETGGSQWLNGHAYRTVINGGNEDVQVSGVAINATVTAGNQDVENEGAAFGTTVNGGQQYVEIGGSATNTTVNDGGKLVVDAEGVLQGVIAGGAVLGVTINAGGVAQLVGDAVTVGESTTEGLINHGSLTKTAGTGTATITANLQGSGGSAALIAVSVGTLQFNGASNNFAAQAITGAGTFTIGGGGASTIGAGTSIGTAGFVIGAGGTTVALAESLAYAGSFRQASSSVVDLGANTLTLSGPASFNLGGKGSPTVTGASGGVLAVTGAVSHPRPDHRRRGDGGRHRPDHRDGPADDRRHQQPGRQADGADRRQLHPGGRRRHHGGGHGRYDQPRRRQAAQDRRDRPQRHRPGYRRQQCHRRGDRAGVERDPAARWRRVGQHPVAGAGRHLDDDPGGRLGRAGDVHRPQRPATACRRAGLPRHDRRLCGWRDARSALDRLQRTLSATPALCADLVLGRYAHRRRRHPHRQALPCSGATPRATSTPPTISTGERRSPSLEAHQPPTNRPDDPLTRLRLGARLASSRRSLHVARHHSASMGRRSPKRQAGAGGDADTGRFTPRGKPARGDGYLSDSNCV